MSKNNRKNQSVVLDLAYSLFHPSDGGYPSYSPSRYDRPGTIKPFYPLKSALSIEPTHTQWGMLGLLAAGELTVLAGPSGVGKSTLASLIAAGFIQDGNIPMPPELRFLGLGLVIYISTEEDHAKSVIPKLKATGANIEHVFLVENETSFILNDEYIERLIKKQYEGQRIGCIILDPIYCAVDGDMKNNDAVRKSLERLVKIARRLQCAILGVAHTITNPKGKEPLARIAGARALREVPRIALVATKNSKPNASGGTHTVVCAKNNLTCPDFGFDWKIDPVTVQNQSGDYIYTVKAVVLNKLFGTAPELLAAAESSQVPEKITKHEAAK